MGRRSVLLSGALLALSLTIVSATRGLQSIEEWRQEDKFQLRRSLLSDLKKAQEDAGILVDDAWMFEDSLETRGRRLQQSTALAGAESVLNNPNIVSAIISLLSSGSILGGFPGAALNLPGGSGYGYAPTNASYCLFTTVPNNGTSAPAPGGSLAASGNFTCVEGTVAGPGSIPVVINGTAYVCSPPVVGRKLLQAASPPTTLASLMTPQNADLFFNNIFAAIGLPIWKCIIATTPQGNTTFGQAALATFNDLGVVAEHLLNYLNNENTITYAEKIQNDFVSLTNPLYPTGPRLNFSIDFSEVAKNEAVWRSVFGFPPPPPAASPPPPAVPAATVAPALSTPSTSTQGGTVPSGSTPSNTGSGASNSSQQTGQQSGATTPPPSTTTSSSASVSNSGTVGVTSTTPAVPSPPTPAAPIVQAALSVFDGYLSNCQLVIGGIPGADGNFNRNNNFQAVIIDGRTSISMNATSLYNGQASYIIPASKSVDYAPLTQATRGDAQYCYDIATLLPVYNPIATLVVANATGMAGNAISTLAVFGNAFGVSSDSVLQALGVSIPSPYALWTYDALGQSINGSTDALAFLKANTAVNNIVTGGANLLTNDTSVYASYAIVMNQAIARKISYSPPTGGRKLLQATPAPAVDLSNATTVADILSIALQMVYSQQDQTVRGALNQGLTTQDLVAVGAAIASLNQATASASDPTTTQLSQYYSQTQLSNSISQLATGEMSVDDFSAATGSSAISSALNSTLPGTLAATASPPAVNNPRSPPTTSTTQTFSSAEKKSSGGGLSHGGKVALATVFPIVAVIAIVAIAAIFIKRRSSSSEPTSNVWYRRPFASSSNAQTAV